MEERSPFRSEAKIAQHLKQKPGFLARSFCANRVETFVIRRRWKRKKTIHKMYALPVARQVQRLNLPRSSGRCLLKLSRPDPRRIVQSTNDCMTGISPKNFWSFKVLRLDQYVVAIVSRYNENSDPARRQRRDHRRDDTGIVKGEWSYEFETRPTQGRWHRIRDALLWADNRKLVFRPTDGHETVSIGPGRYWRGGIQSSDTVKVRQVP